MTAIPREDLLAQLPGRGGPTIERPPRDHHPQVLEFRLVELQEPEWEQAQDWEPRLGLQTEQQQELAQEPGLAQERALGKALYYNLQSRSVVGNCCRPDSELIGFLSLCLLRIFESKMLTNLTTLPLGMAGVDKASSQDS